MPFTQHRSRGAEQDALYRVHFISPILTIDPSGEAYLIGRIITAKLRKSNDCFGRTIVAATYPDA